MSAAGDWAGQLGEWAIPAGILAAAPESPFGFDVGLFERIADDAQELDTPSRRAALEALPAGGSVLDVGCGAGAASLALVPQIGTAVGVDSSADMLAAFERRAESLGVSYDVCIGAWPDVAAEVDGCDVVVCHHVVYNVADIAPFLAALTDHARRRVVVELTTEHPVAWMNPLWEQLQGVRRPTGPTLDGFTAVVAEMGLDATVQRWDAPRRGPIDDERVAFARRRLCLPPDRDGEVAAALAQHPPPAQRGYATVSWDGRLDA